MEKTGRRPDCFIQVNIGDEPQKGGCAVKDLPALLAEANAAVLPVVGLMAVPPAEIEHEPFFLLLARLDREHGLYRPSMGMSGGVEHAIWLCGAPLGWGLGRFGGGQTG